MSQSERAMEFCRAMMHDYEQQWTLAQGHAQRHPLRIKMVKLEDLLTKGLSDAELEELLARAPEEEDWELSLLCADLEPRWRAACAGQQFLRT